MQARAGAIDELLASGALTDLTSSTDDIQAQLDKVSATSQVDRELAALKTELARRTRGRSCPRRQPRATKRRVDSAGPDDAVPDHPHQKRNPR